MRTLNVDLPDRKYPVMVGSGLLASSGRLLAVHGFDSPPIVVTNRRILKLHGTSLLQSLQGAFGEPPVIRIGDGERFKNHATLMTLYRGLFRARANRRSWILAFGGGVVGDIAGFAAATFMRGIPFVMVPTTLLAQIDSSIGGKVAINVPQGKNLIGAFHQPAAVLSDTDVLKTLSERELASGLYEIVKHAAIRSESLMRYLENRLPAILRCQTREMTHIIVESVRIKAGVVVNDEKEAGLRMILNYGHTVGHAFEAATDYRRFKHGEAVAWGMIAAVGFSLQLGFLRTGEAERLIGLIHRVRPLPSLKGIRFGPLWNALVRDKKFRSGDVRMILLRKIGDAEIRSGIDTAALRRFLREFLDSDGNIEARRG
ncbi:MAG: 3-dehydroquinate synthase [Acidobacteria bacterium]|nr:3-dehydroquinate synthase [Acidobacteriota bacterium]